MKVHVSAVVRMTTTIVVLLCSIGVAFAADLQKPSGDVLLKITGNISNTNSAGEAWFDIDMLKAFGVTEIDTQTPWTDGSAKFSGVLLSDLLNAVGAGSSGFQAIGLNKYKYDFRDIEHEKYPIIVAWQLNGEMLTIRSLGPLWMMFPFSDYPEIDDEMHRNAAVWQLIELSVY